MMARGNMSPLEGGRHPEMVQQPRRFACDRCRMQKLRCERDIWRPSLMPCKRCRKARMTCTISSMERSVSKKPKERVLNNTKSDKMRKESPPQLLGSSPPLELADQAPDEVAIAFHNKMMTNGFNMTGPSQLNSDGLYPEECFSANASFDSCSGPIYSGLITPPSLENEREHQLQPQLSNSYPHNQGWAPLADSQGLDYEDRFPCLDDREQHWDQENLRRLLEMNMHLLDCQNLISQKLIMLGNMPAGMAVNNLESALQSVLAYSQQFLEVVKLSLQGDITEPASCHVTASIVANGMIVPLPTPSQSRRPSGFQAGPMPEPALNQEAFSQVTPAYTRQGRFDDVQISLTLAIINCYACLVGSYHIIFSYLLQELMAGSPVEPQPSPIFPSFAFATDSEPNRELQLRLIFINSMRMLAQLEASLGLPEQHLVASLPGSSNIGVLSAPVAMVLIDSLAGQGFGLCVNGLATGKSPLKEIVQAVNQFLEPI